MTFYKSDPICWVNSGLDNDFLPVQHQAITWTNADLLSNRARLNIKTVLFTYGDFHVKDKTAVRTSYL